MEKEGSNMKLEIISYRSADYRSMCSLRDEILRKPIGLRLTEEECLRDAKELLLVAKEQDKVIACCILSPVDDNTVQLRQMAVDARLQGQGVGSLLLAFAEQTARAQGFSTMMMHARKTAVHFYQKQHYEPQGEEFEEVGIPHYIMTKGLNKRNQ